MLDRPIERAAYNNAKQRCLNKNHRRYPDYGGRGIIFHDEWLDPKAGFEAFYDEVGDRPGPQYSLGRIDNEKGYQPNNLEWQTKQEQARATRAPRKDRMDFGHGAGQRKSVLIPHNGKVQELYKWAEEFEMKRATIYDRLLAGWPIADALNPTLLRKPKKPAI